MCPMNVGKCSPQEKKEKKGIKLEKKKFKRQVETNWGTHGEGWTGRHWDRWRQDVTSSTLFNQTVGSGGEEMAAVRFAAATIDLHCSLFQSVTIRGATNNL